MKLEDYLNEAGKLKTAGELYKLRDMKNLKGPVKKTAQEGKRLAGELSKWFGAMLRNFDDLEVSDANKIENAHKEVKNITTKLGFS